MSCTRPIPPPTLNGILLLASVPVLGRPPTRSRMWSLLAAQQLRFGIAVAHQMVLERIYVGSTDVDDYDVAARAIGERLRQGRIGDALSLARTVPWNTQLRAPVSTNLMRLSAGAVYACIGPSRRSAFLVFSWLGFWGLYLFDRAFALAVPEGRSHDYRHFLFLLPSLNFWTATVGKEPLIVLGLGVAAHGSARALSDHRRFARSQAALGAGFAALLRAQAGGRLGFSIGKEVRDAGERSFLGDSRFRAPAVRSTRSAPKIAASVLFRPHLLEAHNRQAMVAALETSFLALLTLRRARWLAAALRSMPRQPYVAGAVAGSATLIAYMSRVANFGMLVRQRASVWPFYAVLLCIPPKTR